MEKIIKVSNGALDFGDFNTKDKLKESLEVSGDVFKVKTYNEVTRLEKNDVMIYESVPGTRVENFVFTADIVKFSVLGEDDASIIIGVEENANYELSIDDTVYDQTSFISPGKLNINVDFADKKPVAIVIKREEEA